MAAPIVDEFGMKYYLQTVSGIPYNERAIDEDWAWDHATATKVFDTPWKSRLGFKTELLGGFGLIGGSLVRFAPYRYPDADWLYCTKVKIAPRGGRLHEGGVFQPIYRKGARITATFETPNAESQPTDSTPTPTAASEITLATLSGDFSSEQLTFGKRTLVFQVSTDQDDAETSEDDIAILVGVHEIQYTRHLVASLPENTISDLTGTLNDAAFPPGSPTAHAKETLMLLGAGYRRVTSTQGDKAYEITTKFAKRTAKTRYDFAVGSDIRDAGEWAGWNRFFTVITKGPHAGKADWLYMRDLDGGKLVHELTDFNRLFDPAAT